MQHVAIMKKSWGMIEKILSGEKTIESRWYAMKRAPWGAVEKGDTIYFKNAGERVSMQARVRQALFFADLTPAKANMLLEKYGKALGIEESQSKRFFVSCKDKKYCMLVFLKDPKKIKPFAIDKRGFGAMSAWISLSAVRSIRSNV